MPEPEPCVDPGTWPKGPCVEGSTTPLTVEPQKDRPPSTGSVERSPAQKAAIVETANKLAAINPLRVRFIGSLLDELPALHRTVDRHFAVAEAFETDHDAQYAVSSIPASAL